MLPARERDIAMVFQNYALYPHMTVGENIGFALSLRKLPKDEIKRRVREAADVLSLTEWLDRKPAQLSGGQRQRVAMGRAIVREPAVFLMDEPLSNLDAKLRVQMRAEVSRIQRRLGVATMYVTHDQTEAMTMGDRVVVLNAGVLQQCDNPQVLYDSPDNLFVAGFMGSPAMNLYEATISPDLDSLKLGSQSLALPADGQGQATRPERLCRPQAWWSASGPRTSPSRRTAPMIGDVLDCRHRARRSAGLRAAPALQHRRPPHPRPGRGRGAGVQRGRRRYRCRPDRAGRQDQAR